MLLYVIGAEELCAISVAQPVQMIGHMEDLLLYACRGATANDSLDGVLTPYVQACSNSTGK